MTEEDKYKIVENEFKLGNYLIVVDKTLRYMSKLERAKIILYYLELSKLRTFSRPLHRFKTVIGNYEQSKDTEIVKNAKIYNNGLFSGSDYAFYDLLWVIDRVFEDLIKCSPKEIFQCVNILRNYLPIMDANAAKEAKIYNYDEDIHQIAIHLMNKKWPKQASVIKILYGKILYGKDY